jgi:hypothetical protein
MPQFVEPIARNFVHYFSPVLIAVLNERQAIKKKNGNLERWFLQQAERYTRTQVKGEKTSECCEQSFLLAYAARPKSFSLSHPQVEHLHRCDCCLPRLLEIRHCRRHPGVSFGVVITIALACAIAGTLAIAVWNKPRHLLQFEPTAVLSRTLDLTDYGTSPIDATQDQPGLALPAANLNLELRLPRLSSPGPYLVAVSSDPAGASVVARAKGNAVSAAGETILTVSLDLRRVQRGHYFLSAQRLGENVPYFYPLEIE